MVGAPVKPTGPPTPPPQKPRPATPTREGGSRRGGLPGPIVRVVLSLIIVWHFTGVFLAALSIPASSPLVMNVAQTGSWKWPMQWYLDALYMNQGHSFFAPDVGPGHILRYELFDRDNKLITQGTLPDKKEHWPRLLYHRHMMLADQSDVPANDQMDAKRMYLEAYARHLLRPNRRAQTVRVQLYAHYPLPSFYAAEGRAVGYQHLMQEMNQGGQSHKIDEQGYELVGEGVQRRSDLPPEPDPPPEPEPQKQTFAPAQAPNPNLNWRGDRPYVAGRRSGGVPR